ncbi:MAG: hypothetical protein ABW173_05270 [Sphingomonas sp.]
MRRVTIAIAAALAGSAASADPYVDHTPATGVWNVVSMEVDPNHLDDYLKGLRRTQQIGMEIMRKRGMIETHYTSAVMLAPDKARDMAIEKEMYAAMPRTEADKAVAFYEIYRKQLDDALCTEVTLAR